MVIDDEFFAAAAAGALLVGLTTCWVALAAWLTKGLVIAFATFVVNVLAAGLFATFAIIGAAITAIL